MNEIIKLLSSILAAFGLAASAKAAIDDHQAGKPPKNIGTLDPNDPIALGDFNFDLMQAQGMSTGDAFAKEHGFRNAEAAEDAIMRIRSYNTSNPAFAETVNRRVGERTQQLMSNPQAMHEQYANWQQPQA